MYHYSEFWKALNHFNRVLKWNMIIGKYFWNRILIPKENSTKLKNIKFFNQKYTQYKKKLNH